MTPDPNNPFARTANPLAWWAPNQPGFVSGAGDPNYGECLGYTHVPAEVSCQAKFWSVQRLCHCVGDVTKDQFFGTGYSGGTVYTNETRLFAHTLDPSIPYGVMTHFWVTAPNDIPGTVIVRYYVDGETTPSVEFQPSMAAGVGFLDDTAPWGTKWCVCPFPLHRFRESPSPPESPSLSPPPPPTH